MAILTDRLDALSKGGSAADGPAHGPLYDSAPAGGTDGAPRRERRPRLEHVDAMRPIKQLAVVTTHSFAFFAPAAGAAVGASVLVTHVSRFAFVFISAAMLVYAYPALSPAGLKVFWRRRLVAIALPYVVWTGIYVLVMAPHFNSAGEALDQFAYYLFTGYYQLYFLLLLLELCLVYPAILWLLRRSEGHHRALFLASGAFQLVVTSLIHWGLMAGFLGKGNGMEELWNYQFFVIAGALLAWHYREMHAWLLAHWRRVVILTAVALALAEAWVALAETGVVRGIEGSSAAAVYQPVTVPMYFGLVLCAYLAGVALVERGRRSARLRFLVQVGVDDSYGIYLAQVLIFQALVLIGWRSLDHSIGWIGATLLSVPVVFLVSAALTSLLARLPGARALAGRPREPWRALPLLRANPPRVETATANAA